MNNFFEEIAKYGFEKENVMERFLNDEEFYVECYSQVLNDSAFDELKLLMKNEDKKAAFDCAHSLKGLLLNVGLMTLFEKVTILVEILRGTISGDEQEYYEQLIELRNECLSLL